MWQWVSGIIAALLAFIGKRLHARQDAFEREYVMRREFTESFNAMRDETNNRHQENKEVLERIHSRVDQLWVRGRE